MVTTSQAAKSLVFPQKVTELFITEGNGAGVLLRTRMACWVLVAHALTPALRRQGEV